jgi:hypothetical protein
MPHHVQLHCWRKFNLRAVELGRPRWHRPTGPRIKGLRSYVEAYGRLVAPAVFNTDVVE